VYIVTSFTGQTKHITDLQRNINNRTKNLQERKAVNLNLYKAYIARGELNKAANHLTKMNNKYAPNHARIESLRNRLSDLRHDIRNEVSAPIYTRIIKTIEALLPAAEKAIALIKKAVDLKIAMIKASAESQVAITQAETNKLTAVAKARSRQLLAQAAMQQAAIQQGVESRMAPIKGLIAGTETVTEVAQNATSAAKQVYAFARPAFPYVKTGAAAVGKFFMRKRTPALMQ